jgi:CBS-domain-containing membrane protein
MPPSRLRAARGFRAGRPAVGTTAPAQKGALSWLGSPVLNPWRTAGLSGVGGFLIIFLLAQLSTSLHAMLLIAPFGASCVLVFALPQSPLAQPRNLIGGHLISSAVGLLVLTVLGPGPLSLGLAVGLAITAMQLTGTLHPPAGADPIVVIMAKAAWPFLFAPVLFGALTIVVLAAGYHRWISKRSYPHRPAAV